MLFFFSTSIFAQGLFESATAEDDVQKDKLKIGFGGYAKGSAYVGFDNFDYSTLFGEVGFLGKLSYNRAFMFADIRFREGFRFGETFLEFQLKEVYAGYAGEKFDAFLGNQIISWGRTDGYNPTNCITPNDYFFLTADPDDQTLSNFMLRFKYRFSPKTELDIITIPVYRPSVYRFELFDFGPTVQFTDAILPEHTFNNSTIAARLNFELSKIGFSVSYFRGYNPEYGFDVLDIDLSTEIPYVTNAATSYLKNMVGADLAIPLGPWIMRGEIAYNITTDYESEMYIPNPDLHYVAGVERSTGGFNTILQYIGKYTFDFTELEEPILTDPLDPLARQQYTMELILYESSLFNRKIFYQQKETNHALSITISRPFAYETWHAEFSAYYNFTSEEYMVRPKISWNITDALTTSAGCIYMAGPEKQVFDYAGPVLNGAFLELKVNF
jgi:hypothetical protein